VKENDMPEINVPSVYFDRPGSHNTARALELALSRADQLDIRSIVVATTTGETGVSAARLFADRRVVVVTHSTGFKEPDGQELLPEHRAAIEAAGAHILTTTHALGGLGRAVRRKLSTYEVDEIVAYALRTLGEGIKVALEMTAMAADAGLISCNEEIMAIAGTGRGADTVAIIKPANVQSFFDLRVVEIICKPRLGFERGTGA
jgi:hypothetical protein